MNRSKKSVFGFILCVAVLMISIGNIAFAGNINAECPKCSHVVTISKCSNCGATGDFRIFGSVGNMAKCNKCGETVVGPIRCPKDGTKINKFIIN